MVAASSSGIHSVEEAKDSVLVAGGGDRGGGLLFRWVMLIIMSSRSNLAPPHACEVVGVARTRGGAMRRHIP